MSTFADCIHTIYDRNAPRQIHPHIGSAFHTASDADLRIMAVGINSYVSPKDEGKESPAWFASWFTRQTYRYQKGVTRDLKAVGEAITKAPYKLASKTLRGMESVFLTNAVKVYVPEASGKRADQLTDTDYERHLDQWHDELDAMAEHNVLPHVIAIVGAPFWALACRSFRTTGAFKRLKVARYESCAGSCLHFLNRIVLDHERGQHELLLVRLRHPAGRTPTGSPKWLLEQQEFRTMATNPT